MTFDEVRKQAQRRLLPNGEGANASTASSSSPPGKPSTKKTPATESGTLEGVYTPREGGDALRSVHCRECKHLRVSRMPDVITAESAWLRVDVVSKTGKHAVVDVGKLQGKLFATCSLKNWGTGYISSLEHVIELHGFFKESALSCKDFSTEKGQVSELQEALQTDENLRRLYEV